MSGAKGARWLVMLAVVACLGLPDPARAGDRPDNVGDDAHEWLSTHLDAAMPMLIQTDFGPLDRAHIYVVTDLGNWGAARHSGGHQGTDFVVDLPHKDGQDQLRIGSIVDATVVHAEENWGAYGNTLFLLTEDPQLVFIFAHLDRIDVAIGDTVEVGDWLGLFGCTGNCRGLKGQSVRHQVHVEVYSMPSDWSADSVNWDHLPLRQLRGSAHHKRRTPQGIDIAAYFDTFELEPIGRSELSERYAHNRDNGSLSGYLDDCEDAWTAELAEEMAADAPEAEPPDIIDVDRAVAEVNDEELAEDEASPPDKLPRVPKHLMKGLSSIDQDGGS